MALCVPWGENLKRIGTPEQIQICEKAWSVGIENQDVEVLIYLM